MLVSGAALRTRSAGAARRHLARAASAHAAAGRERPLINEEQLAKSNRVDRVNTMELTFLGTSSAIPQATRNQQSLVLRLAGESWMFDCGEGTQRQIHRTAISPRQLRRIFISHLHGDHIFGLPALLCSMMTNQAELSHNRVERHAVRAVQIVGPEGIRAFISSALGNSYSTLFGLQLQIHELKGLSAWEKRPAPVRVAHRLPNELPADPIYPSDDGTWLIPPMAHGPPVSVRAVEIVHTVPTVGYVVDEAPRAGALHAEKVVPLLKKERVHLSGLRKLKAGEALTLPSGRVLRPEECMEAPTARRIALLSDTNDPRAVAAHVDGADLLVHEATAAFLREDARAGKTYADIERLAIRHGHSTPRMAGKFATRTNAKRLVLTHFGARFPGDGRGSHYIMDQVLRGAEKHFDGEVLAARDFMRLQLHHDGALDVSSGLLAEGEVSGLDRDLAHAEATVE